MTPDPPGPASEQPGSPSVSDRVIAIVAEALDVPVSQVQLHSSLLDDLGAESIDFLDIMFRIETAFGITIPEDDLWKGSFDQTEQAAVDEGVARLRTRMPLFRWDRLPARLTKTDLPRLITVQTVLDYLERAGVSSGNRP